MTSRPIAERIRAERTRLGRTQSEIAEKLGTSRDSYKQLEDPGRTVDLKLTTLTALVTAGFRLEAIAPELLTASKRAR